MMSEHKSTSVCWLCDYINERDKRNPDAWMIFLFAAAMPYDVMLETLCDRHRATWEFMTSRKGVR